MWAGWPEPGAGRGPGWKAWLGDVEAERALWGEPWAGWDGELEVERTPAGGAGHTHTPCLLYRHKTYKVCNMYT